MFPNHSGSALCLSSESLGTGLPNPVVPSCASPPVLVSEHGMRLMRVPWPHPLARHLSTSDYQKPGINPTGITAAASLLQESTASWLGSQSVQPITTSADTITQHLPGSSLQCHLPAWISKCITLKIADRSTQHWRTR